MGYTYAISSKSQSRLDTYIVVEVTIMSEDYWVYEKTEQRMINGRMSTITVRANRPSKEALKRYAQGMIKIVKQIEEREGRI